MKNLFKATLLGAVVLLTASCGSNAKENVVGTWHVDLSSVDISLGDAVPAEMKAGLEEGKKEMQSAEAQKEADEVSINFNADGTLVAEKAGDDDKLEAKWSVEGDKLKISGEAEGQAFDVALDIEESSADKLTLGLTGEYILAEVKKQAPQVLAMAGGMDLEAMVKGSGIKFSLKK